MSKSLALIFLLLILPSLAKNATNASNHSVTTNATSPFPQKKEVTRSAEDDNLDHVVYYDDIIAINERSKKDAKIWDHWGKWSSCSVSCGVGKMTRWRHCVSKGCATGEKEAQIKTCTLSPC
ncbi:ADAMTS-like protein 3 [Leptinotarsa decemlineata]|uniref:ADAMTS-like protein 3 n=1 Tax=Leptinotarsa decemlineata TaxID=7539 RepID=UPI003D30A55B